MNTFKNTLLVFVGAISMLLIASCSATPGKVSQTKAVPELFTKEGVALEGYDAVAYFTESKPVAGSRDHEISWRGVQWRFATAEHATEFAQHPEKYAPQYGGYCALAVSRGTTASGDPHQWAVVDGKLFVNNNVFATKLWDQDRKGNIEAADVNWPLVPKR